MSLQAAPSPAERLREERLSLPKSPGVYLFQDARGDILYIGKAKSLRARVNSYFTGSDERPRIDQLVEEIAHIECVMTASEGEALQLEQRLIKQHRPPYNVRLREGRGYPYLAVRMQDDYPRVELSWARDEPGRVYFGPYLSSRRARDTIKLINRVFKYRVGKLSWDSGLRGFDEKREHAVRLKVPKDEYRRELERVLRFVGGDTEFIELEIEERMREAAEAHEFEAAARLRDQLRELRSLKTPQLASRALGNVDVLGLALLGEQAAVQVFLFRDGELLDRHNFYLDGLAEKSESDAFEAFCLEYYDGSEVVPSQVVVPARLEVSEGLVDFLSAKRGGRVEVKAPLRGEKVRLQQLADENAKLALVSPPKIEKRDLHLDEALSELTRVLGLPARPRRIECYDVSNLQEAAPVAAMVVFEDGRPRRGHYRKFAMRHVGQDDFAMIAEALERRFSRFKRLDRLDGLDGLDERAGDESGERDPSFATLPDLVVVDGGKGQLSAAQAVFQRLGLDVPVVSLAKREEEVFRPGSSGPVVLDRLSPALHLLQRLRDETHRVAVSYHRQRRAREAQRSVLDVLPGVGPKRKRLLLEHFGSTARVAQASVEELEAVPGLPRSVARDIRDKLNLYVYRP